MLLSCNPEKVSLEALKGYPLDPDHGLCKSDKTSDAKVELIYRPKELIIEQNAGLDDPALWDSTASQLSSYDYFVLRLSKNNKAIENNFANDQFLYTNALNYLNGGIVADVKLLIGDEKISVSEALFAPAYGMSNESSVLLVFDSNIESKSSDFAVIFEDTQFETGRHEFAFNYSDIAKIPSLKR